MARTAMLRSEAVTSRTRATKLGPESDRSPQVSTLHDAALPPLDRIIHERMRLGIVSALAVNDSLTFNELKRLLQTTDGNLSVHARRLEEAEYVTCSKGYEGRVPKTEYRLTAEGRKAFERYLDHMEALIHAMRDR